MRRVMGCHGGAIARALVGVVLDAEVRVEAVLALVCGVTPVVAELTTGTLTFGATIAPIAAIAPIATIVLAVIATIPARILAVVAYMVWAILPWICALLVLRVTSRRAPVICNRGKLLRRGRTRPARVGESTGACNSVG